MSDELKQELFLKVKSAIQKYSVGQDIRTDNEKSFHVYGSVAVEVGKKVIDGQYFASAIIQKNFVGFYFFPIYTHKDEFHAQEYPALMKCLKGKSCFHIKKDEPAVFGEMNTILEQGARLYDKINWR